MSRLYPEPSNSDIAEMVCVFEETVNGYTRYDAGKLAKHSPIIDSQRAGVLFHHLEGEVIGGYEIERVNVKHRNHYWVTDLQDERL